MTCKYVSQGRPRALVGNVFEFGSRPEGKQLTGQMHWSANAGRPIVKRLVLALVVLHHFLKRVVRPFAATHQHHRRIRNIRYRRSEEHTSELQSLMRISYAVFSLKKNKYNNSDF